MSQWMEELMAKKQHPERTHEELWFNEDGEVGHVMIVLHFIFIHRKLPQTCIMY